MAEGDVPKIKLGGKEWPIPEFPWRVTKKILPLMSKIGRIDTSNVTEETMDNLTSVMFLAVSVGTPDLKRDDFENMPLKLPEMIIAIPVITAAADLKMVEVKPGEEQVQAPTTGPTS